MNASSNLKEREEAWTAGKAVGATLKDGLENLRNLRNASVKPLGYSDYFAYQASEYGMTVDELLNRWIVPLEKCLAPVSRTPYMGAI